MFATKSSPQVTTLQPACHNGLPTGHCERPLRRHAGEAEQHRSQPVTESTLNGGPPTQHVGGAQQLDKLGQCGARVVAVGLLAQRGPAQQRVLHRQGRQAQPAALHLAHQRHQPLQARAQRGAACMGFGFGV